MQSLMLVACVSLAALALAGCNEDPERYPDGVPQTSTTGQDGSATTSASGSSTSSSGTTTGGPANRPPTGSMAAQVNGTNATFTLSGSDPENGTLSWTLAFGDGNSTNGTSLPANVTHAYNATGNLTARFTLSDGVHSVNYTANVTLGGAGQQAILTGTMVAPDPTAETHVHCLQALIEHEGADAPGVDVHPIDPAMWGGSWVLAGAGIKAQFEDWANAALLAEGTSGEVPEGSDFVHICSESAVNTAYTLTIDY